MPVSDPSAQAFLEVAPPELTSEEAAHVRDRAAEPPAPTSVSVHLSPERNGDISPVTIALLLPPAPSAWFSQVRAVLRSTIEKLSLVSVLIVDASVQVRPRTPSHARVTCRLHV